ncbi:MAG: hypothetical protein HY657_17475 [Acidobacteria bacterium]|nr:hypothetical protein [Acidobacteriota bacterium]
MELSETGRSRLNGYLFLLRRSLRAAVPRQAAEDALREIESHLRDRIAATAAFPDERTSLEHVLAQLGTPLRVAQAYAAEHTLNDAVASGRTIPMARAIGHLAVTTVAGFLVAELVFIGYATAFSGLVLAMAKLIVPDRVGFWFDNGVPVRLAMDLTPPPGEDPAGGYWVVVIGLAIAVAFTMLTTRGAKRFLGWYRLRLATRPVLRGIRTGY